MRHTLLLCGFLLGLAIIVPARADNWPQWRGPEGNSVSRETNLPIAWNESTGIDWKTALPESGNSTPAIWGDSVFVTAHHNGDLKLLCLDKSDGEIKWTRTVGSGEAARASRGGKPERGKQKFHQLHNLASPSPVTNGEVVVVHFGNGDLAAYDFAGKQLWKRNLQEDHGRYSIWWGHANSPVIYDDTVISVCMHDPLSKPGREPEAKSYVVAHDLKTGKQQWITWRHTGASAEEGDSYTTPVFHKTDEGKVEMIVMGGNQLDSYDPATGKQNWFLPNIVGGRTVTGPTVGDELIYTTQGMRGPLLAVKLGGEGELTRDAVAWRYTQGTPDTCSPVVWGDAVFAISDDGIARCFDAYTGHLQWKQRLDGNYKASPLAADGRIYFLNTDGLCTVISASRRFDKLTENQLDDTTLASPAVSDGKLFIRGHRSLYCIGR